MRPGEPTSTAPPVLADLPPWPTVLRALRDVRGITQAGWALRLSVSRKTVQRWESGDRAPDAGAEAAILHYCRESGLLRAFDRGPLAGLTLTEERLRDLLGEARWRGARPSHAEPPAAVAETPVPPHPTNLPVQLTTFVGRARELAAVRRVQAGTRLLTLVGAGGSGKSRLALALADELTWGYPHGVWFAGLAPLADPALLTQFLAAVLGVRTVGRQPLTERLIDLLRERHLLLVLDNCEHLLPACAELVETLLRGCPHVEVLATSRQPLGIGGETIWRVPPLALPRGPLSAVGAGAEAGEADAIRLFVERARLQLPEFAPSADELAAVTEICRRLDGMPLAIELAAARVNVLSVSQLAARLNDRFRLLVNQRHGVLPRHRTLRAALDWGYDLLTAEEQALLRALAVFAGGFTLEAAEAVCGAGAGAGETPVLDRLARLVDKSLVTAEQHGTQLRYGLLETVRGYAGEKLAAAGDGDAYRARHAVWCLGLAAAGHAAAFGPHEVSWLTRLDQEHDNLRAALGWAVASAPPASPTALRLSGLLVRFWELRGHGDEGRRWLQLALAGATSVNSPARALAQLGAGSLAYAQGDFAAAQAHFEAALTLARELDDQHAVAEAAGNLGRTALRLGDTATARDRLEAGLALATRLGHQPGIANAMFTLGVVALRQGDYELAQARFEASLAINRQLGNREGIANALEELATVHDERGDAGLPSAWLDESLALYRELGDRSGVAAVLGHLGVEAWTRGDLTRATELLNEGLVLYRAVGDRRGVARLLGNQSLVAYARRDYPAAESLCRDSLRLHREAGDAWAIGRYLPVLAGTVLRLGQPERAAHLFGAAAALREQLGAVLPPVLQTAHDRTLAAVRAELGEVAFAAAWAAGRATPAEIALDR